MPAVGISIMAFTTIRRRMARTVSGGGRHRQGLLGHSGGGITKRGMASQPVRILSCSNR